MKIFFFKFFFSDFFLWSPKVGFFHERVPLIDSFQIAFSILSKGPPCEFHFNPKQDSSKKILKILEKIKKKNLGYVVYILKFLLNTSPSNLCVMTLCAPSLLCISVILIYSYIKRTSYILSDPFKRILMHILCISLTFSGSMTYVILDKLDNYVYTRK